MTDYKISFNKPCFEGNELRYITESIENIHISGDGPFSRECHAFFEKHLGVEKAMLTTSCTHALEMAALLLNLKPEDEIILPSFTFVSTANAFKLHNGKPVFVDIRPDTLNLDQDRLEELITPKTRAIIPVHYAGIACEMDQVMKIAEMHGLAVIEDNAHGIFGKYKGRNLGTFGCMAALSFHETKNFTCGEGGALLINEPMYIERAEIIREKGTNRTQMARGQVDKYTWIDIGSSYLPSDLLAAFLYAQLEAAETIQRQRKRVWDYYYQNLRNWTENHSIRLPVIPEYCKQPYHMFYMIMPNHEDREKLIAHLNTKGIQAVFHYLPLHLSKMGRQLGYKQGDCPMTEDMSLRLIRLPFYNKLTQDEQDYIIESITRFYD
ncbi:MAG: dTDP-4-amino-4,6-dideoxygalactose transaminase [Planctomycetota bacterium]